jgi:general secretion pathway protein G
VSNKVNKHGYNHMIFRQKPTFVAPKRALRGFTLLEMLIVMVLIGMLAALVGPRLFGRVETAKVQSAQTQIKLLENAVSIMALEIGGLPPANAGLNWLTQKPEADPQRSLWKGPYLEGQLPKDPWNNAYVYKLPGLNGREFSVVSYGQDGQPGGEGMAADVASK